MTGSNTQLLQMGVRSAENYTKRVMPNAGINQGKGASCTFPDVMLSMHNQSKSLHTFKKADGILLVSPDHKKESAKKEDSNFRDLPILSNICMNHQKIGNLPNHSDRVEANQVVERERIQATRIGEHPIQAGIKSTADVKHPVLNMQLMEHLRWEMANVKTVPSKSSQAVNHQLSENGLAAEKGAKPKVEVQINGMKSPMMWFEARMWGGMNDLLSKPGIMARGGHDRYDAVLNTRNSVNSDRVAQKAVGSTTNGKFASKVQDIALTPKDSESAQKPITNQKGTQNPASNPNTEPVQSNGKETANIATSTETTKVTKEAVGATNVRNTSSKASSVVSKGKKNAGKTNSSALQQRNSNIKTRSKGKPEVSVNGKQAAKQQVPSQEISEMVMAAEKGAKPKVGVQVDGVASPISGVILSSNGQAVPVNTAPAQSHSRWDSLMRFVERIMQNARIQHRQEGVSELRVRMVSETLGKLMLHVSVSANHVDVRFALDTLQARQIMHSYKAELAQILKDSGASTVNIDVSTSSADGEERFRQFSEADDRYGHRTFNSQVPINDSWDYPENLDREDELASPATTVNFPYEHSSMVWVA